MMYGGFMMIFGWLALLVVVVFGAKILLGDAWWRHAQSTPNQGRSAIDILKERYAQGELSDSEYQNMKEKLLQ